MTIYDHIAICYDKQNRYDDAAAMRQKSADVRRSLQQLDIINQTSANAINRSQGMNNISI